MANTKKSPLISIIITFYNLAPYVKQAIKSCFRQDYSNIEIILINDGSTDLESIKTLNQLKAKYASKINFIDQPNRGVAAARNRAIKTSKGELICCLDADDILNPTYISQAVNLLQSDPKIGIVGSWTKTFGTSTYLWKTKEADLASIIAENSLPISSVFRKKCWQQVKGYDTKMSGYQDWDFWISIIEKGWNTKIIPKPLFCYRIRPNSMVADSNKKRRQLIEYILKKHSKAVSQFAPQIILKKVDIVVRSNDQIAIMKTHINDIEIYNRELKKENTKLLRSHSRLSSIENSYSWLFCRYFYRLEKFIKKELKFLMIKFDT